MKISRIIAAALLAASPIAHAGAYTDLWWNPAESGWGMNVVQQDEVAFVTLFVYGPAGEPQWYVASDARVIAYSTDGFPVFSGTLYRTQGPWHGGVFDPAKVGVTRVGSISIEARAKNRLRVEYEASGVQVMKDVERQTWAMASHGGNYDATFWLRQATPGETPFGTLRYNADLVLQLDGQSGVMHVLDNLGRRCEYRGAYRQSGKLATMAGGFTCTQDGAEARSGSFEVADLEITEHGLTGYLRTNSPALTEYGRFGGARW